MNAKISVFVICIETVIYLLLYNLHDCTFNGLHINYIFNLETIPFIYYLYNKKQHVFLLCNGDVYFIYAFQIKSSLISNRV